MPANDIQHGGKHYKKLKIQHWDYVEANGIPYLEACAIKYLTRWRDKGGIEDLRKAIHYIEKRIELETERMNNERESVSGEGSQYSSGPGQDSPAQVRGPRSSGNSGG